MRVGFALGILAAIASVASAKPAFDPREWKASIAGPPTQVLTLGTPHLSQLSVTVTPAMLGPLLDKLATFRPDIITHEGLSGEQCDLVQRSPTRYPDIYESYCWSPQPAREATGLDVPQAMAAIERTFAKWPATPTSAARRQLAAFFLAAGDRASAQVQWQRLAASERHEGDGLNAALVSILMRKNAKPNETFDVAVALAVRLGHDRVFAVDDHTADSIQAAAGEGFGPALQEHWSSIKMPLKQRLEAREKAMASGEDVLSLYRLYNQPETLRTFIEADFHGALQEKSQQLYGRQYVAWYEARNLRMVANIRAAFGNRPGSRVLNVVGASHKAYYDAYLDMIHEVKLVDAELVLK